ncbi:expressed unknown protein [Seminavis robusta]|uniref:Uncharacterized protein n=1 Tax=Seminavis robusta TaxID=568900 RepID=A0A9N8DSV6_9STRA|nr:expressed unknown protein [Seminavis robusta]|eukprot:Sro264_g102640.1 n/a (323) ;mRNA; r:66164-67132
MLFHTTTRIKKVHIDWDTIDAATSGWAVRQMIDQAKSKLEDIEGGPPITLFSIGHLDSEPQPEAIRSLLLPMKNLIRLDLFFGEPQTVSHELCKALCDLIKQGKLQEVALMGPTAAAGTLLPLLDAADKSNTMTRLRLEDLGNEAEVEIYQDEMLRILDHNTQLEAALICDEIVNASAFTDSVKAATARINNEWCWRQFEGSRKQRLIDCKALLNMCGRGKAKAEGTQLEDIVCMISPDTLVDKIQFLNFEGEAKQELITILQHGLLRQQPATWLPLRKEAKSARSNNESGASSTGETRGTRKRKATGPPDGHGDHGASSSR